MGLSINMDDLVEPSSVQRPDSNGARGFNPRPSPCIAVAPTSSPWAFTVYIPLLSEGPCTPRIHHCTHAVAIAMRPSGLTPGQCHADATDCRYSSEDNARIPVPPKTKILVKRRTHVPLNMSDLGCPMARNVRQSVDIASISRRDPHVREATWT